MELFVALIEDWMGNDVSDEATKDIEMGAKAWKLSLSESRCKIRRSVRIGKFLIRYLAFQQRL